MDQSTQAFMLQLIQVLLRRPKKSVQNGVKPACRVMTMVVVVALRTLPTSVATSTAAMLIASSLLVCLPRLTSEIAKQQCVPITNVLPYKIQRLAPATAPVPLESKRYRVVRFPIKLVRPGPIWGAPIVLMSPIHRLAHATVLVPLGFKQFRAMSVIIKQVTLGTIWVVRAQYLAVTTALSFQETKSAGRKTLTFTPRLPTHRPSMHQRVQNGVKHVQPEIPMDELDPGGKVVKPSPIFPISVATSKRAK